MGATTYLTIVRNPRRAAGISAGPSVARAAGMAARASDVRSIVDEFEMWIEEMGRRRERRRPKPFLYIVSGLRVAMRGVAAAPCRHACGGSAGGSGSFPDINCFRVLPILAFTYHYSTLWLAQLELLAAVLKGPAATTNAHHEIFALSRLPFGFVRKL